MSLRTFIFGERVVEPQKGHDHRLKHDRMHRIQDAHRDPSLRAGAALLGQRVRSKGDSVYDGDSATAAIRAQRGRAVLEITHDLDPETHASTTTHRRIITPSRWGKFWGEKERVIEVTRSQIVVTDTPNVVGRLRGEQSRTRTVGTEKRMGSVRAEKDWQRQWRRPTWNMRIANAITRWERDRQKPTNGRTS